MFWLLAFACAVPDEVTVNLHLGNVAPPGSLVASDDSVHDVKFAPGLVVVHDPSFVWLVEGEPAEA